MWDEEGLDDRIDEEARRLTAGTPGGDLRARVINRLESRRERRWTLGWILAPIAAGALAIVISVNGVHRVHWVQEVHQVQEVQVQAARAQNPGNSNLVNPVNPVNLEVRQVRQVQESLEAQAMPAGESVLEAIVISPLATEPLEVSPLVIDEMPQAAPLVVEALSVPLIQVRALDAPAEFNQ